MSDILYYTPEEVAKILKISKGTVYELIKRGELPSYRIGRKMRVSPSDLEAFTKPASPNRFAYQAASGSIEQIILECGGFIICGQDIVLDVLTRHIERLNPMFRSLRSYVGSLDGLLALYRGTANVVTTHLWDSETGEYNIPYVRRLLPGQYTVVINLVYRYQGFYVSPGNPKNVRDWGDLTNPDVTFINREKGSGTRILLDEQLRNLNIDRRQINGYQNEELSHIAVASSVARGLVDVGLGIEKAALQVPEVEFVPLKKERYDIVVYKEDLEKPSFQALLAALNSREFRAEVAGMGGYDISQTGEIMSEI
ncbi:helix-turn-helix transcriptional regulator [Pelotomaculum isophthalicicum JI]|uniref:Helix-turn-helix transcriptional regulator n=1 Tax=Pelotomaculum isophthalicicum JI TaxID=947010 RepID=A0A9X4JVA4_9FIRM|nr:helix-turn-helix transcriptional regulator [Pelotomaculum isophthalicicum]MDF9407153.1 helix-turn-helix transcriptional regulator [Pelotomaculum isophthalicicum JI]